jgi:hypothetical protein
MLKEKLIKFYDDELLGVKDENEIVWMSANKTMQDIGLSEDQCKKQARNIKNDIVLSQGYKMMSAKYGTMQATKEMYFIREDFVTLWLAKISLTPTMQKENPKTVEKLVKYQFQCKDVLHEAFFGTEEKRQQTYNDLGLEGEIKDLKVKIEDMDKTMGTLINSATINSYQAKQINKHARERVSTMLGGAHSKKYKDNSRTYFKNLWLGLCDTFNVSEYRDLNPLNYSNAVTYVSNWSFS